MNVLVRPDTPAQVAVAGLEALWKEATGRKGSPAVQAFRARRGQTHTCTWMWSPASSTPETWDEGGGPDYFEVSIGNLLAHGAPFRPPAGPCSSQLRTPAGCRTKTR